MDLDFIHFIRISPEGIKASSEITEGRIKNPITKPDHPTATGAHLIVDVSFQAVQFYEITSAVKGQGGKMVEVALKHCRKSGKLQM